MPSNFLVRAHSLPNSSNIRKRKQLTNKEILAKLNSPNRRDRIEAKESLWENFKRKLAGPLKKLALVLVASGSLFAGKASAGNTDGFCENVMKVYKDTYGWDLKVDLKKVEKGKITNIAIKVLDPKTKDYAIINFRSAGIQIQDVTLDYNPGSDQELDEKVEEVGKEVQQVWLNIQKEMAEKVDTRENVQKRMYKRGLEEQKAQEKSYQEELDKVQKMMDDM